MCGDGLYACSCDWKLFHPTATLRLPRYPVCYTDGKYTLPLQTSRAIGISSQTHRHHPAHGTVPTARGQHLLYEQIQHEARWSSCTFSVVHCLFSLFVRPPLFLGTYNSGHCHIVSWGCGVDFDNPSLLQADKAIAGFVRVTPGYRYTPTTMSHFDLPSAPLKSFHRSTCSNNSIYHSKSSGWSTTLAV